MPRRSLLLLFLALAALYVVHAWLYHGWIEDDAFITFRYAQNLVGGHGLVFNPGERVEAFSNPSWVMLSAVALGFGLDPVVVAQVVGILAGLGCLILAWRLTTLLFPGAGITALLAPFLLTMSPVLTRHAVSGLETVAHAFILLAATVLALESWSGRGRRPLWLCALLLLVLSRPEGLAFAVLLLAWDWYRGRSTWRDGALLAGVVAVLLIGRVLYYGDWLPNTFYFKMTGGQASVVPGLIYARDFVVENGFAAMIVGCMMIILHRSVRTSLLLLGLVLGLQAALILIAGGDWMHHYRFWAPVFPILAASMAAGLGVLLARVDRATGRRGLGWIIVLPLLLASGDKMLEIERQVWCTVMPSVHQGEYYAQSYERVGRWLASNTPPGTTVAVGDVGAIGYFSGRNILDILGLIDRHIARTPGALHLKNDTEYVMEMKPSYLVLITGPSKDGKIEYRRLADELLAGHPDFDAQYVEVETMTMGFQEESARIMARIDVRGP